MSLELFLRLSASFYILNILRTLLKYTLCSWLTRGCLELHNFWTKSHRTKMTLFVYQRKCQVRGGASLKALGITISALNTINFQSHWSQNHLFQFALKLYYILFLLGIFSITLFDKISWQIKLVLNNFQVFSNFSKYG